MQGMLAKNIYSYFQFIDKFIEIFSAAHFFVSRSGANAISIGDFFQLIRY